MATAGASGPEPSGPEPPVGDRSLAGFYLALGLVAGLAVFAAWVWNPLRAAHWERQVRSAYERGNVKAAGDALDKLEALGPAAKAAAGRLLAPNRAWYRGQVIQALDRKENRWLLPALVRLAREDGDRAVVFLAVRSAESISGRIFFLAAPETTTESGRARLLDWWDREGRDKYDR